MLKQSLLVMILGTWFLATAVASEENPIVELDYEHWTIWYNCDRKGYEAFHYTTVPNTGDESRYSSFRQEPRLPARCRQHSTGTYQTPEEVEYQFDRGHGVHQNIWDHDRSLMRTSNSMANIVPQSHRLNRWGVWRHTERLTNSWRDCGTVTVWGGVIWGDDRSNDYFVESHGVDTPDLLWKVVQFPDGEVNAWLMPNDDTPAYDAIDDYLIHPDVIGALLKVDFNWSWEASMINTTTSRTMTKECDVG